MIPGTLINLNLQYSFEEGFYSHQGQQQALYSCLSGNNNSMMTIYQDSLCYPEMEQLHSRTADLLKSISGIQSKMVQESESQPDTPAVSAEKPTQTETELAIQYKLLSHPFLWAPVKDNLLPECTTRQLLNTMLKEYSDYLAGLAPDGDIKNYTGLIDPSNYLPGTPSEARRMSLMSGLHSLELLKNSILTAESLVFNNLASH
jgi:hypothetical protein